MMRKRSSLTGLCLVVTLLALLTGGALPTAAEPPRALAGAGTTTRVSVAFDGTQGNGLSTFPSISGDGSIVAFYSLATNLVPGDTNDTSDIFVNDRQTGETTRVSVAASGTQANGGSTDPSLSADGRYVAFASSADNLVPDDTNGRDDIFVHDRQTGQTTRISVASDGTPGNGDSYSPSLSADGRIVAFASRARNLVPGDTPGWEHIYVHDRQTGETTRVSVASDGTPGRDASWLPSVSADGRTVAFVSIAHNLVPGGTTGCDVFVHDRQTGETILILAAAGTQGSAYSWLASLSADGSTVALWSSATDLRAGDVYSRDEILVRDRQTQQLSRVSVASGGVQGNDNSFHPSLSADGSTVAFWSIATNLVPGDSNDTADIFVHDRQTGETIRASVAADGTQANGYSWFPSLSADGTSVAFASSASNLVPGDTNGATDVFIHDQVRAGTYSISGRVTDASGNGIPGVTVWAGFPRNTTTDGEGNYTLSGLLAGTYNIRPDQDPYVFSPASRTVTVVPDATGQDFTGMPGLPTHTTTGRVSDGHNRALSGVFVGLLRENDPAYVMTTITRSNGDYLFAGTLKPGKYTVRVILRDADGLTQIHYGAKDVSVSADSPPFYISAGYSNTVNIDFGDPSLVSPIPSDRLDDLATIFRHVQQVNTFVRDELDVSGFQPVRMIWAFSPLASGCQHDACAYYCELATELDECPYAQMINLNTAVSNFDSPGRPMNREWHETFHHLQNAILGPLSDYYHVCQSGNCCDGHCVGGDCNHRGFENHCTGDSWIEGWAEFWPCVLSDNLDLTNEPWLYRWGQGPISIEYNWRVWDKQCFLISSCLSREEFAVASLLWDLYDGRSNTDNDNIDLSLDTLWGALSQATPEVVGDMRGLYELLGSLDLQNEDGSPVNALDLDMLFIVHGFFADDGDQYWEPGEQPGWGGMPARRSMIEVPNAYFRVDVEQEDGSPVQGATCDIQIHFEDGYYDFSYTVDLPEATENLIGLGLPPTRTVASADLTVNWLGGHSQTYTIDNNTYWTAVRTATGGYAVEHTFVVPDIQNEPLPSVATASVHATAGAEEGGKPTARSDQGEASITSGEAGPSATPGSAAPGESRQTRLPPWLLLVGLGVLALGAIGIFFGFRRVKGSRGKAGAQYGHICPHCQIQLPSVAAFCTKCGTRAIDVAPPKPAVSAKCARCGAQLGAQARYCTNCGAHVEIATPERHGCPACQALIPVEAIFCPNCGVSLSTPALATERPTATKAGPEKAGGIICPACGRSLPVEAVYCPNCGASLSTPAPATEEPAATKSGPGEAGPIFCLACGTSLPSEVVFCPNCGEPVASRLRGLLG